MEIVPLALGPSFLTDMGCSKKCLLAFSALSRLPRIGKVIEKVIDKIIDKVLSLSNFWTYLVNIKIVKITHLNNHISYINKKKTNSFL